MSEPCHFLQWDSDFFEHRIARVDGHLLDSTQIAAISTWCKENGIECLYFLADADSPETVSIAQAHDFHLVEIRLTMERWLKDWNPETRPRDADVQIRPVQTEDIPALQKIAMNSYIDSRYFFDIRFPKEKWQAYYATWVKKSCQGGADMALVAEMDSQVVGYITGNVAKGKPEGIYELTGVDEAARRLGVGQELFRSGLDWYVRSGIEYIWVATQGRNIATQRMIQRHGFITRACQLYYHKWFTKLDG